MRRFDVLPRILGYTVRMATAPDSPSRPRMISQAASPIPRSTSLGHAQLSLVEHALCPLDASAVGRTFIFETEYDFSDENRHRKKAKVRVACPDGLSPTDEFYLWGLLSLTFSQPQATLDFHATPYYCLRHLGSIDPGEANSGGKNYVLFRNAIARLSTVSYRNDHFYDPLRGEHRSVGFGFLSYSLPIDTGSSRAWRFAWDPIFYEFCQASAGALRFDFHTYRHLDPACRRLYLLLKKIFWRNDFSQEFDLHDLAVNVVGFAGSQDTWKLKQKLHRCIDVLLEHEIIRLPEGVASSKMLFVKRGKKQYAIRFHRGAHFLKSTGTTLPSQIMDSPLYDPLRAIGFEDGMIRQIVKTYKPQSIAECADMTLAARERFGDSFFKNSPQAYFIDNIREQAAGTRTPPDWWHALRKEEERRRWKADRENREATTAQGFETAFDAYIKTEAREAFQRVMDRVFHDLKSTGQPDTEARNNATYYTRTHFIRRFRAEHPEWNGDGPSPTTAHD